MADKVQFELVSPERLLLSEAVEMVTVPGSDGNFGVLPGHALFISTVRAGVIEVYGGDRTTITERIFVAGGFAEVTPERCTVLADEAIPLSALDATAIEANMRVLEGNLVNSREHLARAAGADRDGLLIEQRQLERHLAVASAKLDAVRAAGGAH